MAGQSYQALSGEPHRDLLDHPVQLPNYLLTEFARSGYEATRQWGGRASFDVAPSIYGAVSISLHLFLVVVLLPLPKVQSTYPYGPCTCAAAPAYLSNNLKGYHAKIGNSLGVLVCLLTDK